MCLSWKTTHKINKSLADRKLSHYLHRIWSRLFISCYMQLQPLCCNGASVAIMLSGVGISELQFWFAFNVLCHVLSRQGHWSQLLSSLNSRAFGEGKWQGTPHSFPVSKCKSSTSTRKAHADSARVCTYHNPDCGVSVYQVCCFGAGNAQQTSVLYHGLK